MKPARAAALVAVAFLAFVAVLPWWASPPVRAQILPTSTLVPPSSTSTTRGKPKPTTTVKPGTTSSTRPRSTTTSSSTTTLTTIAPPSSLVPTEEEPPAIEGQGDLSKVFAILSGLGFAVAIGMIGTQLFRTRREDQQFAARVRDIVSRRALRRTSRRPPP